MNFKSKKEQQLDILEKLVEANQDYLFRFAYFRVGSREVAEDIVQNVFLKLIENCIDLSLMKTRGCTSSRWYPIDASTINGGKPFTKCRWTR